MSLQEQDLRAVLDLVGDAHHADDLDEFRATVLAALPGVVPADFISYNEVPQNGGGMGASLVAPDLPPWAYECWGRLGMQNPLIGRYQRTRDGRAYRVSDVASQDEFRALDLYREFYAPLGVEHQLAFCLPSPVWLTIGVALSRGGSDFSERDRRVIDLARPHLIQAYRNAELRGRVAGVLDAVRRGLDDGDHAMMLVSGREVVLASAPARRLLRSTTGSAPDDGDPVPAALATWLREGAGVPLVLEGRRPLVVRCLRARDGGPDVLFLEPGMRTVRASVLRQLGLTRREAEVLSLIVRGQGNDDVAGALGISPRTVHKHVEHVFSKLGVTSRLEAVATVWAAVGVGEADPDD